MDQSSVKKATVLKNGQYPFSISEEFLDKTRIILKLISAVFICWI